MPNAGGLIIAPSIEMADYFAQMIETIEGERPVIVHSDMPNADQRIRAFRNGDKRWIVSVAMVSEGVDIKRLRVLAYLPKAQTELAFRQAVGRVVRTLGPDDDTRAYVVMPSFHVFEEYAKRVENEMNPTHRAEPGPPRSKVCPVCRDEVALTSTACPSCGHEFPPVEPRLKSCASCESLNPVGAAICQVCGSAFAPDFALTLDDALRQGAIVRGIELDEAEVLAGETIAPRVRQRMLSSGDETLVKIVRSLPEESWARLREIFSEAEAD
jgi:hypothetical protein